ncbi:MAG: V-type ATP synthase subunit F [Ruminococcus sp.]|nr:V-type ATP synthase subunit F [Ruminococcus sp.]
MYRVAVLGDKESIYGFAALGLDVFFTAEGDDAEAIFKKLTQSDYAVIYVTEHLAQSLEEEIAKFAYKASPAIIQIPGVWGNTGKGMLNVKKSVEKAVGSDIIFND